MKYKYKDIEVTASSKEEAISIISKMDNATAIEASLTWGVEGIEKLKNYGDVLFYVVNGTRYGVKPKKGNKNDTLWYYEQLKLGMKTSKGYASGLVQFLNTWIRKGELTIVFKGKATASVLASTRSKTLGNLLKEIAELEGIKLDGLFFKEKDGISYVDIRFGNLSFIVSYSTKDNKFEVSATKNKKIDDYVSGIYTSLNEVKDKFTRFIRFNIPKQVRAESAIIDTKYTEVDKGFYKEVSPDSFIALWRINDRLPAAYIPKVIHLMRKASREIAIEYINKGIVIKYFYGKQEKNGYIRLEYDNNLYIIYLEEKENKDLYVVTKKIKRLFPVKQFDILMCSLPTTTFDAATLPFKIKNVWGKIN